MNNFNIEELTDRVIDAYSKLSPNAFPPTKSQKIRLAKFIEAHGWEEIQLIFIYLEDAARGFGKKKGWTTGLWGIVSNYEAWTNWGINSNEWGGFNRSLTESYLQGFETYSSAEEEQYVNNARYAASRRRVHFPKELLEWARGYESSPKQTQTIMSVSQLLKNY